MLAGAPHSAYATPDNKCVLSPNIAQDRVYAFAFDAATGGLASSSYVQSPPGTGPRHLAFAAGRVVWVLNEPSTTLTGWTLSADSCTLAPIATNYSTIRPRDAKSDWHAAEIRVRGVQGTGCAAPLNRVPH